MLETLEYGLSILLCCISLSLELYQEQVQLINAHGTILRVKLKRLSNIIGRLCPPQLEHSSEAKTHLERLLRHIYHKYMCVYIYVEKERVLDVNTSFCYFSPYKGTCIFMHGGKTERLLASIYDFLGIASNRSENKFLV